MSIPKPKIVVIGSSNTDLVVTVPHIPAPGETILGGNLRTIPGGKGANQAVAAARLGGAVTFIARVGDDAYGQTANSGYQQDSIDTRFVRVTPNTPSGIALITIDATTGQNAIVVAPGANAQLAPEDIDAATDVFQEATMVVASLEVPMATVLQAAKLAQSFAVPFLLNPAPAQALPDELLRLTSILTPNEIEAAQILGIPPRTLTPVQLALALREVTSATIVMTVGAEGAVVLSRTASDAQSVPGLVVKAVDTVAAGDCFTGALAVRLALGEELLTATRYANAAAALKVTRHGAQPGIPTADAVDGFLSSTKFSP